MSTAARKARKRNRRDQGYSTVTRFEHPKKTGTHFMDRLSVQPRPIFGIATSNSATRFGITSRVARQYIARGFGLAINADRGLGVTVGGKK